MKTMRLLCSTGKVERVHPLVAAVKEVLSAELVSARFVPASRWHGDLSRGWTPGTQDETDEFEEAQRAFEGYDG